ncbi:5-hydroxytryptamine receptor 3A-like isoform X2 [Hyla sarda]|uniref:5-hydroxytryptamine receptor 3A-like isoform X2 n=1 Tax=Hyla sarda TaxID=327740 RepID=UPI0024C2DC4E|nr:5-hydroxytryptamine receptor 3A-like isoform X2 [Hyla sarda]
MHWTDEFLQWNPTDFDNMTITSIPTETIWIPDIKIAELVAPESSSGPSFVYINNMGLVKYQKTHTGSSMCLFYIYFFPFDVHNCTLSFYSQLHSVEHINIFARRTAENMKRDIQKYFHQGEWILSYVNPIYKLETNHERKFALIVFHVIFKRFPMYYVVNLIIPSIFLMILDIIGFYLPNDSGERISFKTTLLLGYSVFLIIVLDILPASSHNTPIINTYFIVCMALLGISLAESILVFRIMNNKIIHCKVPTWIRKLVLEKLSILVCLKDNDWGIEPYKKFSEEPQGTNTTNDELDKYADNTELTTQSTPVTEAVRDVLGNILKEIVTIRQYIKDKSDQKPQKEWLLVGYILDKCLFWVYLGIVMAYIVSITIVWSYHIVQ